VGHSLLRFDQPMSSGIAQRLSRSDQGVSRVFQIGQNEIGFDAIMVGIPMQTEQEELREALLAADIKTEAAMPRIAPFARHAISRQNRKPTQPMKFNIETSPKISFDLDGVSTINESVAAGSTIFSQGDIAETLMYIQRGCVKLSVTSKTDKDAIVAILGPGEFLGEACLGTQNIRMGTATAIAATALQVIEGNEMVRALHADHALAYCFLSYLISRNVRLEKDLADQVSHSSERQLARALLLLAGKGAQRRLHRFAGISQETLATIIGTTRASVNFFMNKFRKLGFIKYHGPLDANGGIHINSSLLAKARRK
jgi:CRP/FNR family cyclic AMP-dependent transcriptional regulator